MSSSLFDHGAAGAVWAAYPWSAQDLEARRCATVNQPDIRVLSIQGWTGTHDSDSSGAASI
ncbi:hypothetical protein [Nitrospira tepida]|uniref:hypothetical protein n=1 Tax=Nitrospira tepida TaxID=2973512 RepID=UPI00259CD7A4|nr:hypothetical protein [Nitrospira tepida]